jgi:hypothetical protein
MYLKIFILIYYLSLQISMFDLGYSSFTPILKLILHFKNKKTVELVLLIFKKCTNFQN